MEFWGVEVPSGKPLTCDPGDNAYLHVSQASLGETKSGKGNERVILKVKAEGREVVIGTLAYGRVDQIPLDLIFDKGFILSHNSTSSVYFAGYRTEAPTGHGMKDDDDEDSSDSDEEHPSLVSFQFRSGQPAAKGVESDVPASKGEIKQSQEKMQAAKLKPETKEMKMDSEEDDDKDSSEEESDEDEDDDEDEDEEQDGKVDQSDEDDDSVDEDDESNEEIEPQSAGKKRPLASAMAAGSDKKFKVSMPSKAAKSGIEKKIPLVVATQQEAKARKDASGKKTRENSGKNDTPASAQKLGQYICQPCKKTFQTESALSQHNSAKHK